MIPWKLIGIGLAVLAIVGTVALHFKQDADTRADLKASQAENARLTEGLRLMTASKAQSEALRRSEGEAATLVANEAQRACSERLEVSRNSTRTIERIVRVPANDPTTNCPARGVVPTDELRRAITGAP